MWYCGLSVVFHILALQANQRHQINHFSLHAFYTVHTGEKDASPLMSGPMRPY